MANSPLEIQTMPSGVAAEDPAPDGACAAVPAAAAPAPRRAAERPSSQGGAGAAVALAGPEGAACSSATATGAALATSTATAASQRADRRVSRDCDTPVSFADPALLSRLTSPLEH